MEGVYGIKTKHHTVQTDTRQQAVTNTATNKLTPTLATLTTLHNTNAQYTTPDPHIDRHRKGTLVFQQMCIASVFAHVFVISYIHIQTYTDYSGDRLKRTF